MTKVKHRTKRRPRVNVTAEMIATHHPAECYGCAIAMALNTDLGGHWWVGPLNARDEDSERRIRFTPRVQGLMRKLDRRELVEPFSF